MCHQWTTKWVSIPKIKPKFPTFDLSECLYIAIGDSKPLSISSMFGRLEIVSLKPQFSNKRSSINYNEVNAHKRYNSVNNRTIVKYDKDYNANMNKDLHVGESIFPGSSNRKNHSQIARMELNELESDPFSLNLNHNSSRRSDRKRFKMPQISGKKKLPNWFSITSKEIWLQNKKLNFDNEINQTMNVTFRKVQSEQVSPRTIIHKDQQAPSLNSNSQMNKFFMSKISKQEWNDPTRFAPIINHL
jgi:hypothetical protein